MTPGEVETPCATCGDSPRPGMMWVTNELGSRMLERCPDCGVETRYGDWRDAEGALKGIGSDEPAEDTIRRIRGHAPRGIETPEAAVEALAQAIDDWQDETHWYGESLPSFAIAQHLSRGLVAQGWTPPGTEDA